MLILNYYYYNYACKIACVLILQQQGETMMKSAIYKKGINAC